MRLGLLLACTSACAPSALPPVQVLSITPSTAKASDTLMVMVGLDVALPVQVDFGSDSVAIQPLVGLSIGGRFLGEAPYLPDGGVQGLLLSGLAPGAYDVTARLADGRAGTLPGAFAVAPGSWPTGYAFSQIPDQHVGQPFWITVQAQGPEATGFDGSVDLSSSFGAVSPPVSGTFQRGVLLQQVVIQAGRPGVAQLTATDALGTSGTSNTFNVRG